MNALPSALSTGLRCALYGILATTALGGEIETVAPAPAPANSGDWCEWLGNKPGTLYKSDNPFIQEFGVFGRFQWQAAYMTGEDVNGYEFSDDYTEVRRFRLGAQLKFLNFFTAKANVNLADDARHSTTRFPGDDQLGWGYEDFDEALLIFDAKKAFGIEQLDALEVAYGRHKFVLGSEARTSSKKLLTVERSAISNKVYDSLRPTGLSVNAAKGDWEFAAAIYSTDADVNGDNVDFIGGWNDGLAYYLGVGYQATDELSFYWDMVYNDAQATSGEDSLWGYEWATAFTATYDQGSWGVIADLYYGDNGDADNGVGRANRQGDFWGLVVMPHLWLVQDKLEGVVRYQYAGASEDQGIRANSRYVRRDHGPVVNVNSGRGNEHHSIYGGLNYYLCGHNLKVQTGLEYEWFNAPGVGVAGDVSATTYWFGFRSFF
ncbi:porin [Haloferula sargassicola]|uniref:Alginate export domain-containing protein n=1 Tax=Haloferula sargassicola TaxID=490096 RepID=A0ABP9UQ42_9BACT